MTNTGLAKSVKLDCNLESTFPLTNATLQTAKIKWPDFNIKGALGI
jgi:hypothetical protein